MDPAHLDSQPRHPLSLLDLIEVSLSSQDNWRFTYLVVTTEKSSWHLLFGIVSYVPSTRRGSSRYRSNAHRPESSSQSKVRVEALCSQTRLLLAVLCHLIGVLCHLIGVGVGSWLRGSSSTCSNVKARGQLEMKTNAKTHSRGE
jgi:hypothetical protein